MTGEVSKAASDALCDADLATVMPAFTFMKACAQWAGVPHAQSWQLGYLADGIAPWRIVDQAADAGSGGTGNVAFTFQACSVACLRIEIEAYAKALRGLKEIYERGFSQDLMAATRR